MSPMQRPTSRPGETRTVTLNLTAKELTFLQKVTRQEYHFITDDEQQARLDPRHDERRFSNRQDSVPLACLEHRVPHVEGIVDRDPDLVAEIPGEAGAGDRHA